MRITIFDTETTGLPKRDKGLEAQPHVIQFASMTFEFDPASRRFIEADRHNQLIKPPIAIPEESTRICGITDETVANAPSFAEVSEKIIEIFAKSDLAIAHNLNFDREILENEFERLGKNKNILPANLYDSMEGTRDLCKLQGRSSGYKAPKLMELHQFLLNEPFEDAHNAEKDVEALARCVRVLLQEGIYQPVLIAKSSSTEQDTEQISLF
jgi:DNA polymerase III epsilon subunit-like protein